MKLNSCLSPFYIFNWSFYQDRLGINMRKTRAFSAGKMLLQLLPVLPPVQDTLNSIGGRNDDEYLGGW
eukprot:COSAG06_NODE_455_length_15521_cov_8.312022_13_plen_68_part_00